MKKLSVLIALVLLVVAGTGYAVTCAQDNVPGATLLVPYFRVSGNGTTGGDIPALGTDTLCAVTNVSNANIIVHITVWNKYSRPVLDFNVPMTPFDVIFWSMRSVLNGNLIVNPTFQRKAAWTSGSTTVVDPCGQFVTSGGVNSYQITRFLRFSAIEATDIIRAISVYSTPAFSGSFRNIVWTSLDESGDITDWLLGSTFVLDSNNPDCYDGNPASTYGGDFSGYVTIDVANYCTLRFPNETQYYQNDGIATAGWGGSSTNPDGGVSGPNILIGDVFYIDQTAATGNISGDPMVSIEFDSRIDWQFANTFYGRFYYAVDNGTSAPLAYRFKGDGREPLGGRHYGFRYVQDNLGAGGSTSLRTWALVWRTDRYRLNNIPTAAVDLCGWWSDIVYGAAFLPVSDGFTDPIHQIGLVVYDNDEQQISQGGGPSGGPGTSQPYIFLETQRLVVSPNGTIVPSNFFGGWIDLTLPGDPIFVQNWVGVQHTGFGLAMSVGHSASLINNQFVCFPNFTANAPGPFPPGGALVDSHQANQTN